MGRPVSRSFLAVALLLFTHVVLAVPISLSFTATVQSVDPTGSFSTVSGSFTGGATFDSTGTPIYNPLYPDVAYSFSGIPYGFFVNVPGASNLGNAVTVDVADNGAAGLFVSDTVWIGTKSNGVTYSAFFSGPNSSFATGDIPSALTLSSFYTTAIVTFSDSVGKNYLVATIDSAQFTPVPLPLPLTSLVSGIVCLGAIGRRKDASRSE